MVLETSDDIFMLNVIPKKKIKSWRTFYHSLLYCWHAPGRHSTAWSLEICTTAAAGENAENHLAGLQVTETGAVGCRLCTSQEKTNTDLVPAEHAGQQDICLFLCFGCKPIEAQHRRCCRSVGVGLGGHLRPLGNRQAELTYGSDQTCHPKHPSRFLQAVTPLESGPDGETYKCNAFGQRVWLGRVASALEGRRKT